jgi:hypothetical protein
MKLMTTIVAVTAALAGMTLSAEAGTRSVDINGAHGGTYSGTTNCVPGSCQRSFTGTNRDGQAYSGSGSATFAPGQYQYNGTVVGPNGGVYKRRVNRNW